MASAIVLKQKTGDVSVFGLLFGGLLLGLSLASCDMRTTSVTITAEEFRFSPNLLELTAHQTILVTVRNQGREPHAFQSRFLVHDSVNVLEKSFTEQWLGGDGILLKPGQWVTLSMELRPGFYPFRCGIKGHKGMEGTLIVVK